MSHSFKTSLSILGVAIAAVIPALFAGEIASSYMRLQNLTEDPQNGDQYGTVKSAKREFVTSVVRTATFIPSMLIGLALVKKYNTSH